MKLWLKAAFFAVTVAALSFLWMTNGQPRVQTEATVETEQQDPSINILLLGCDASGVRPDSIMLIHVNGKDNKIDLLSLPRDGKMQQNGRTMKLNTVLTLADNNQAVTAVEELTEVTVDYYVKFKPGVFAEIVDALDGLENTVEQDMHYSDPTQDLYIDLEAGKQTLSGEQCEQYCRYRSYAMGDLSRTQHQQKLLTALVQQKAKLQYVVKLPAIYNIIKENTETDLNGADVAAYLPLARAMAEGEVQIETHDCPGTFNDMEQEGVSYYLIDRAALHTLCKEKFSTM